MNYETTTKDGAKIKVEGAGPEMPKVDGPPSNKQIDSSIKTADKKLEKEKHHLDSHGKTLVSDTQSVLKATSTLNKEKNKEERFQKLYHFTRGAAKDGSSESVTGSVRDLMGKATGMGSKVSSNASDLPSYIRETILNITTSTEYRELVIEFLNLIQSMLGSVQGEIQSKQSEVKTSDDPHHLKTKDESLTKKTSTRKKLKNRLSSEDEQMEVIREKLTLFLRHISQQPEYQSLVRNFLKYSEEIYDTLYETSDEQKKSADSANLRKLLDEAWEILGEFAGRDLVLRFRKNLHKFAKHVQTDKELRAWAKESKHLLLDLMDHPEHATTSTTNDKINSLIRQGRILGQKYRIELNDISTEARRIMYKIRSDPAVKNFNKQLKQLFRDLTLNSRGEVDLFVIENSISQIKNLLVEMFRKVLIDVPIKRIEMKSDALDLELKDISIKGNGLVPEMILVKMTSFSEFSLQKHPDAKTRVELKLRINELKPEFKEVKFKYERKSFPSIKDEGVADMTLDGTGLGVVAAITFTIKSGEITKARLTECSANLDKIGLNIHKDKTKHDTLDSMMAPMVAGRLRTKMQTSVEETMETRLNQFISQMNDWFATKPFNSMMVSANQSIQDAHTKKQIASEKKEAKEQEAALELKKKKQSAKLESQKKEMEAHHQEKNTVRPDHVSQTLPHPHGSQTAHHQDSTVLPGSYPVHSADPGVDVTKKSAPGGKHLGPGQVELEPSQ